VIGPQRQERQRRQDPEGSAARDANDLESRLQIWMLQARRNEKDFLSRHDQESLASPAVIALSDGSAPVDETEELELDEEFLQRIRDI